MPTGEAFLGLWITVFSLCFYMASSLCFHMGEERSLVSLLLLLHIGITVQVPTFATPLPLLSSLRVKASTYES